MTKMKINFFNERSPLYDFRWILIMLFLIAGIMIYHDIPGGRMFTSSKQQQWKSSGPGSHK